MYWLNAGVVVGVGVEVPLVMVLVVVVVVVTHGSGSNFRNLVRPRQSLLELRAQQRLLLVQETLGARLHSELIFMPTVAVVEDNPPQRAAAEVAEEGVNYQLEVWALAQLPGLEELSAEALVD
jgi:hypothetical protein